MNLWELPGPRRWLQQFDDTLDRSAVSIACHPSQNRALRFNHALCAAATDKRRRLEFHAIPGDVIERSTSVTNVELAAVEVANQVGIEIAPGERFGVENLLSHPLTDAAVLYVDAQDMSVESQQAWLKFAAKVASTSKEAAPDDRIALVLAVRGEPEMDLPSQDTNLRIHWWWGVVGPLDLAVALDDRVDRPLVASMIAEVARWDLTLALDLASRWDGDPTALDSLVAHDTTATSLPNGASAGRDPGVARTDWVAGDCDSWEGRLDYRIGLCSDLSRRMWRAQVRIVYPWLEELRAGLGEVVAQAAVEFGLPAIEAGEIGSSELGQMKHLALREHRITLSTSVQDVLRRAVAIRNHLAHLRPIPKAEHDDLMLAARRAGLLR